MIQQIRRKIQQEEFDYLSNPKVLDIWSEAFFMDLAERIVLT